MGRHTAEDGASAHPLVAAALAQRASDAPTPHRGDAGPDGDGIGWPKAPEPGGDGVGWPGRPGEGTPDGSPEDEAPVKARRGWRRLFGAAPAA